VRRRSWGAAEEIGEGEVGGVVMFWGMVGKVGATAEVLSIVAHPNMIVECLDEKLKDSPLAR
jgi:molybdopterin synthase catalytic subunit